MVRNPISFPNVRLVPGETDSEIFYNGLLLSNIPVNISYEYQFHFFFLFKTLQNLLVHASIM